MENNIHLSMNSEPQKLLEFKLDFSCAELRLNQILASLDQKINSI